GLIYPDTGEISIAGFDLRQRFRDAISRIGSLIEIPAFYGYLSARQNLQLLLRLSDAKKADEKIDNVLRQVKLLDRADDAVKKYSQGMRQRLGIAAAILRQPPIVILDEPTNGLDPEGMIEIREFIRSLAKETGTAVLLSSHLLSEMEMLCDRVFILNKGKTIAAGAVKELILPEDENLEQLFLRITRTKTN
ncbi:MAG: ATP-binding cassette domain-containing protein, partial [Calditrichaeota bacterium]|nr:ATP-binding cassette domain-containing protein [Calditrichota bacterium]